MALANPLGDLLRSRSSARAGCSRLPSLTIHLDALLSGNLRDRSCGREDRAPNVTAATGELAVSDGALDGKYSGSAWQREDEPAAGAELAVDPEAAAVRLDQVLADGEAEARARSCGVA